MFGFLKYIFFQVVMETGRLRLQQSSVCTSNSLGKLVLLLFGTTCIRQQEKHLDNSCGALWSFRRNQCDPVKDRVFSCHTWYIGPVTVISLTSTTSNELVSLSRPECCFAPPLLSHFPAWKLTKVKTIYLLHWGVNVPLHDNWMLDWLLCFFSWLAKQAKESKAKETHFWFVVGCVTERSPVGWDLCGKSLSGLLEQWLMYTIQMNYCWHIMVDILCRAIYLYF